MLVLIRESRLLMNIACSGVWPTSTKSASILSEP